MQGSNTGDKVQLTATGNTTAGTVTIQNQTAIVTLSGNLASSGSYTLTVTSPLIDQWTAVDASVYSQNGDAGGPYQALVGNVLYNAESLNSQGEAAVITPGTVAIKITNTVAVAGTHPPIVVVMLQ